MGHTLETKIDINASAELVRQVFLSFDTYPEWSEFIKSVSTPNGLNKGSVLKVVINTGSDIVMAPELEENSETEFRWRGRLLSAWIFEGAHSFKFISTGSNTTRLEQTEVFVGGAFWPLWYFVGKGTEEGFVKFNEAIKKRAEKLAAAKL